MEKQDTVLAVYAESLVFESNFGFQKGPDFDDEVALRAQSIPAADAADQIARASGATPLNDQVWSIF